MKSNKIKEAREEAEISQSDLAGRTGISQAQISRYESNDYDLTQLPHGELIRLSECLGEPVEYLIQDWIKEAEFTTEWCNPYEALESKNGALSKYIDMKRGDFSEPFIKQLDELKKVIRLKNIPPITILKGRFDAGKSFLINKLLNKKLLGVGYQPETVMVTFLVHKKFRPEGLKHDVSLYREGFDFLDLIGGDLQEKLNIKDLTLDQISGISISNSKNIEYEAAVIFDDSPILESTILVDTPGFAENLNDTNAIKALRTVPYYNNVLYLTPLVSAFDQNDKSNIKQTLSKLPLHKSINTSRDPFANVTFLITHAHSLNKKEELSVINKSSINLYEYLKDMSEVERVEDFIGRKIKPGDFGGRMLAFWFESKEKRKSAEVEIENRLCEIIPPAKKEDTESDIKAMIEGMEKELKDKLGKYQKILEKREEMKKALDELEMHEPERRELQTRSLKKIHLLIDEHEKSCIDEFEDISGKWLEKETLKKVVEENFSDKKVAQKSAANYVSDRMIDELNTHIGKRSKKFSAQVNKYLEGYNDALESAFREFETDELNIGFDVQGAFVGGFAGAATLGAFSFWAASLGNLGGYIITAKIVSILASIGISVGGTGAVSAFLSTIGGPITLFIALSIFVGTLTWKFFGESWQSRLAKRVVDTLKSKGYQNDVKENLIQDYWGKTHAQLDVSAEKLEREYLEYIKQMKKDIESMDENDLRVKIQEFMSKLHFFTEAPYFGRK